MNLEHIAGIALGVASPEQIREWSRGEVRKPETINYRTLKPEKDGLFCEKIFGPAKDWQCACGKYKGDRHAGVTCDRCGVTVGRSRDMRSSRMGHIDLAAPCAHPLWTHNQINAIGMLLGLGKRAVDRVLAYSAWIVLDPGQTPLMRQQLLTQDELRRAREKYPRGWHADTGAKAIRTLLADLDLPAMDRELTEELQGAPASKARNLARRLSLVRGFIRTKARPEWMVLDAMPVLPADLRPIVQMDGGRFASSDLNDLYRRIINRNNRLKKLHASGIMTQIIVHNECRLLQEAVNELYLGRHSRKSRGQDIPLPAKSRAAGLADHLKGKQGRFRQNLLGKRVDFSGRSVIVAGPSLRLNQCGLPKEMALELFKPFVMKRLVREGFTHTIKSAKRMVERQDAAVWDVLEAVIREHPVLLNRAPTLHRLGVQAFEPVLVEGRAIRIHPMVCPAFNADFDGDQMAVHVPLTLEAQAEARILMLSTNNILNPKDGRPVASPTQDMVLGCYYLTLPREGAVGEGKAFASQAEVMLAHEAGALDLHARITVRHDGRRLTTTLGRLIFNEILPEDLRDYDRTADKKTLSEIVARCHERHGAAATAQVLDGIKRLGFHYATRAGVSIAMSDLPVLAEKPAILDRAEARVQAVGTQHRQGLISDEERYQKVIEIWSEAKDEVADAVLACMDPANPVYMMATSGARGNMAQVVQLTGMRGLMADPSGRTIEAPVKACFREGLTMQEYFISTHGARKGLADTSLRTSDAGFLTRRLVEASQAVTITARDCGTGDGIVLSALAEGAETMESPADRAVGRIALDEVRVNGAVLVRPGEVITPVHGAALNGAKSVRVRSPLTCAAKTGICAACYGVDPATGRMAEVGDAVGVIAAQSIGEPGTQLTLRTFHTGGVAGEDITQGLPRVEQLLELRPPVNPAVLAWDQGKVVMRDDAVTIDPGGGKCAKPVQLRGRRPLVRDGDMVRRGQTIIEGVVDPNDVARILGLRPTQQHLVSEIQKVYRRNGVALLDKHIEVVLRAMVRHQVTDPGTTDLVPGMMVDAFGMASLPKVKTVPELVPLTMAGRTQYGWLTRSGYMYSLQAVADAALHGQADGLRDLAANVALGRRIPAGTGAVDAGKLKVMPEAGAAKGGGAA